MTTEVRIRATRDKFTVEFPSTCVYCGSPADKHVKGKTDKEFQKIGKYSSDVQEKYGLPWGAAGPLNYRGFDIRRYRGQTAWESGYWAFDMQVEAELPYCSACHSALEEIRLHNPLGKGAPIGILCGVIVGALAFWLTHNLILAALIGVVIGAALSVILYRRYPPTPLSVKARDCKKHILSSANPFEIAGLGIHIKTLYKRSLQDFLRNPYYVVCCTLTNSSYATLFSELNQHLCIGN